MRKEAGCPKCGNKKYWKIRRGARRCSICRHEYRISAFPVRLKRSEWKSIIKWFILEQSISSISEQTGISRYQVMRALLHIRRLMALQVPEVFSGTVEVDETYLGGQWKNKKRSKRSTGAKRGRGTSKQPVFGILCRGGKIWATLVDDVQAKTLMPLIKKKVAKGSTVCSDTFRSYTGVASGGYVHRLVNHGEGEFSAGNGNHINGLEGFWGYLKRKLAAKGGIRRERLNLYLAEYLWRYNNRDKKTEQKVNAVLRLVYGKNSGSQVAKT